MTLPRPRLALSLLTLTLALSGCVNIPSSNGYGTRDDPRYGQLLDLINEALKADMAVVLVADLMPHASLKDAMTMTQSVSYTHLDVYKRQVLACKLYLAARVAHYVVYAAGIPVLRTLLFFVGFGATATVALALLAALP